MTETKIAYWYKGKPYATDEEACIVELADKLDLAIPKGVGRLNRLCIYEYAYMIKHNLSTILDVCSRGNR